jgi:hypothetical protein
MKDLVLDLTNYQVKATLISKIRELTGNYRITIVKHRGKRSISQNAYFHAVVVPMFADWCREQGNEWTDEEAKSCLKEQFLRKEWTDIRTGEILYCVLDTRDLDTQEFWTFVEKCCAWIAEFCGIVIPEPTPFYEPKKNENAKTDTR